MMTTRGDVMMRRKYGFWLVLLLFLGCARKQPTAPIYDATADARRDLAAAIANAEGSKKNIVLIFGANW
jgi:phage baseplate assembly protein W